MEALRPALQQTVEEWSCFERDLREVSLHTTRVRCDLQHQPLFSLKQAEGYMDLLQVGKSTEHHILHTCAHEGFTAARRNNHMLYFIVVIIALNQVFFSASNP